MRQPTAPQDIRRDLVSLLPKMRRFALTLARNAADADDLVQETCERAIAKSHLWNGEGRLESWIYAMTRNLWVDEVRKRKVRVGAGAVNAAEQNELTVDPAGEKSAYIHQINELIMSMPEGLSSVFVLVNIEGYSYKEAAGILGIPIGTVMSRLSAARLRLAAMVSNDREPKG